MDMDKYKDKERGAGENKACRFFRNHNAVFISDNSQYTRPGKACFLTYAIKVKQRNKRYRPALPLFV